MLEASPYAAFGMGTGDSDDGKPVNITNTTCHFFGGVCRDRESLPRDPLGVPFCQNDLMLARVFNYTSEVYTNITCGDDSKYVCCNQSPCEHIGGVCMDRMNNDGCEYGELGPLLNLEELVCGNHSMEFCCRDPTRTLNFTGTKVDIVALTNSNISYISYNTTDIVNFTVGVRPDTTHNTSAATNVSKDTVSTTPSGEEQVVPMHALTASETAVIKVLNGEASRETLEDSLESRLFASQLFAGVGSSQGESKFVGGDEVFPREPRMVDDFYIGPIDEESHEDERNYTWRGKNFGIEVDEDSWERSESGDMKEYFG